LLAVALASLCTGHNVGDVTISRSVDVRGNLISLGIHAGNFTSVGNVNAGDLLAGSLVSESLTTDTLTVSKLIASSGTITIDGDLIIVSTPPASSSSSSSSDSSSDASSSTGGSGSVNPNVVGSSSPTATSFLAESIVIGGVEQWRLVRHDDFQNSNHGWTRKDDPTNAFVETSSCRSTDTDRFLGGHCVLSSGLVHKTFSHLPPHKQIKVSARVHYLDHWNGESVFLVLGDQYVWAQPHTSSPHYGMQMCGNANHKESKFSTPVEVTIPHAESFLTIGVGATSHVVDKELAKLHPTSTDDPCERSFGVDDVSIYLK